MLLFDEFSNSQMPNSRLIVNLEYRIISEQVILVFLKKYSPVHMLRECRIQANRLVLA